MRPRPVTALALALVGFAAAGPSSVPDVDPASGVLLVASERLRDPNFAETVVLLLEQEPTRGAMGVVINRRTDILARDAAAPTSALAKRDDLLYHGGPVALTQLTVLVRRASDEPAAPGDEIVDGVVAVRDEAAFRAALEDVAPERLRMYAGYAGWAPGQLEAEIARGDWHLVGGHERWVFAAEPESVWAALVRILSDPLV